MDKRQSLQLDSLTRGVASLERLPKIPLYAEVLRLRDELTVRLARLNDVHFEQFGARMGRNATSRGIDSSVKALRGQHLIRVSRRAKRLFKHDAAVLKAVRVPPGRATPLKHATAALAMVKALRPHVTFCHASGFRRGFLTELQAAGKHLAAMAKQSDAARANYSRATRRLRLDLRDARELASVLDGELRGLIMPGAALDEQQREVHTTLSNWAQQIKLRKRVGRPPKRRPRRPGLDEPPGAP